MATQPTLKITKSNVATIAIVVGIGLAAFLFLGSKMKTSGFKVGDFVRLIGQPQVTFTITDIVYVPGTTTVYYYLGTATVGGNSLILQPNQIELA